MDNALADLVVPLVQDYEARISGIHASQTKLVQTIDALHASVGSVLTQPEYPELRVYTNRLATVRKRVSQLDGTLIAITNRLMKLQALVEKHNVQVQRDDSDDEETSNAIQSLSLESQPTTTTNASSSPSSSSGAAAATTTTTSNDVSSTVAPDETTTLVAEQPQPSAEESGQSQ
jgi:hypothetical protein